MVATTGGSPIKPSEVALLEVDSVAALTKASPDDWQALKKATKAEVRQSRAVPCIVSMVG